MQRTTRRRTSATRILGLTVIVLAYFAALVWASDLNGSEAVAASAQAGGQVANAVQEAAAEMTMATASGLENAGYEAPLVTLAIAVLLVVAVAVWLLLQRVSRRRPLARTARLVVRHITTLM